MAKAKHTYRVGEMVTGPDRFNRIFTGPVRRLEFDTHRLTATGESVPRATPVTWASVEFEPATLQPKSPTGTGGPCSFQVNVTKLRPATAAEVAASPYRPDGQPRMVPDVAAGRMVAMRRVIITDKMRAEMPGIPPSCGHCGDDLDIHDWIDVRKDGTVVNCDRSEP
jgi:hypothetical protein